MAGSAAEDGGWWAGLGKHQGFSRCIEEGPRSNRGSGSNRPY
jgi:hypothetical protein